MDGNNLITIKFFKSHFKLMKSYLKAYQITFHLASPGYMLRNRKHDNVIKLSIPYRITKRDPYQMECHMWYSNNSHIIKVISYIKKIHLLEVVSRYRDPHLQVGGNYSYSLFKCLIC